MTRDAYNESGQFTPSEKSSCVRTWANDTPIFPKEIITVVLPNPAWTEETKYSTDVATVTAITVPSITHAKLSPSEHSVHSPEKPGLL